MVRPVKKLIERNYQFTNNTEQNDMLNDCLTQVLKHWLKAEPKHTQTVKENIVDNIEKRKISSLSEMDKLMENEYCERIYRNHMVNNEEMGQLKKIKSPGIIILISNEPEHEIKEKLKKYYKEKNPERKIQFKNKIENKILKMKTLIEFIKSHEYDYDNDINKNNENEDEQKIDMNIREIKIRKKWDMVKQKWKNDASYFTEYIIKENKDKLNEEDLDTKEIHGLYGK